jgi:GNAT superfamily N-acetyltransferase
MLYTIHPLTGDDAAEVAVLLNIEAADPTSAEAVRERIENPPADRIALRLGARGADGTLAGYGHALRDAFMEPGLFWLHVAVHPTARRHSLGARLYADLRDFATAHGATTLRSEVRDNDAPAFAFARAHGFVILRHVFESRLSLATFDERPFLPALDRAVADGIRFFSLAEVGDTQEARRRLWELERTVALDVPGGSESSIRPFEVWERQVTDPAHYLPAGQLVAAAGDTWVGMATLLREQTGDSMYHGITGVLPASRGRGLATALKLQAVRVARAHSMAWLRTHNDAENAPMLAVNRKLGYQPEPGLYRLGTQVGRHADPK